MIEDFRSFEDGREFETDLCIIGGGAAGITIARELIGTKARVLLLESGGRDFEQEVQDLYKGTNIGFPYFELDAARLRYFGGSTNHWGNYCGPLNDIDFERREWIPHSGWPITRADLEPYYRRAQPICALGRYEFDERRWKAIGVAVPPFDSAKLLPSVRQVGPTLNFAEAYGPELEKADNIHVLLHANVVNIQANETARSVAHLDIRTLTGKTGRVKARTFVLACGGIENPRLLLASNSVEPKGLGNQRDRVGRFFMDHPTARRKIGVVTSNNPLPLVQTFLPRFHDRVRNRPEMRLSAAVQESRKCMNVAWHIGTDADLEGGVTQARELWQNLKNGAWPDDLGEKTWRILSDFGDVANNAYNEFVLREEPIPAFENVLLEANSEQSPNPESRVILGNERDPLGMPRVRLDWRMTEIDKRTLIAVAETAAAELARLGFGRTRLEPWVIDQSDDWGGDAGDYHHMGTTRMAEDPKNGVIDGNCRMHGIANLYIAGSSVFPTSGYVNPTFTIVALALRLADHLKERVT